MASNMLVDEIVNTEDTVSYWLFPHDENWTPITDESHLQNFITEYIAFLYSDIKDYIWNNESFSLYVHRLPANENSSSIYHIRGKIVVGDYLEDEWFVVYLLTKLTKSFPGLICRIFDNDGEFLLIEAAHHLPPWANPETTEGRVYLREGLLHIVSPTVLPLSSSSTSSEIAMASVGQVAHAPSATLANPAIQSAISLRIEEYPRKISREHHNTHAYVPVGVAALLHEYPTLVSVAVRSFCSRDALDNKCLRVMRHFPPETRVLTSVRFSKALYAQLAAHPYTPDKRTGWNIPPTVNNAHVIGMKLACGFEILVCSAGGVTPSAVTPAEEDNEDTAVDNNPMWIKYKESLKEKGYFRGEMEGSKLFGELETNAHRFFVANKMMSSRRNDDVDDTLSVGSVIVKLLSKINADYDLFKQREKSLLPPDDEKWLEVDPEAFDSMLESKFRTNYENRKTDEEIAETLNAFLKHTSSFEGAEIPEELRPPQKPHRKNSKEVKNRKISNGAERKSSSSGPKKLSGLLNLHHPQHRKISSHSNTSDSSEMSSFSAKVDFNAEAFTDALNNILEYSVPEDDYFNGADDDSSGMSSYEDDNDGDIALSRKISDGSTASKASSGVEVEAPPPQRPPRKKKSSRKIPLATFDDFGDDSDGVDEEEAVAQLLATYKQECGVGPATSLLSSLNINASKK